MNPALTGTEHDTPSLLRVLGGESHHWFCADCLEFINSDAQTTTGNYLGLSKQMRQHWEKVGINPSDLIALYSGQYEAVIVDSPAVLGETAKAVLLSVDLALVPVPPSNLDLLATAED
jgi:cellulose biosynthesis protein BcsQ